LGQPLEEAQVEHVALARCEPLEQGPHAHTILERLQGLVLAPDLLVVGEAVLSGPGIERDQAVGVRRVERLENLLLCRLGRICDLPNGGGALEVLGQLGDDRPEAEVQLLQTTRHAHRPALVPEVPLQLADDGWRGVGGELDLAIGVEPVDRLDQADRGDLDQVVQRLAAAGEPPGQVFDQAEMSLDQLLSQGGVVRLTELSEEHPDLRLRQLRMPLVAQVTTPLPSRKVTSATPSDTISRRSVTEFRMVWDHFVRNCPPSRTGESPRAVTVRSPPSISKANSSRDAGGCDVARIRDATSSMAMWRSWSRSYVKSASAAWAL